MLGHIRRGGTRRASKRATWRLGAIVTLVAAALGAAGPSTAADDATRSAPYDVGCLAGTYVRLAEGIPPACVPSPDARRGVLRAAYVPTVDACLSFLVGFACTPRSRHVSDVAGVTFEPGLGQAIWASAVVRRTDPLPATPAQALSACLVLVTDSGEQLGLERDCRAVRHGRSTTVISDFDGYRSTLCCEPAVLLVRLVGGQGEVTVEQIGYSLRD